MGWSEAPREERQVGLIFRIKFKDGSIRSYSYLQKFNNSSLNEVIIALEGFLELRSNEYKSEESKEIIFSYFIFSNNVRTKNSIKKVTNISNNNNKDRSIQKYAESYFKFLGYNFPVTSNLTE